jgi:t-SNARE complex subunit (syntaxin)
MKMEQTEMSETSAYKIQTPGNYTEESIQHTEHGESLKSRMKSVHVYMDNIICIIFVQMLVCMNDYR